MNVGMYFSSIWMLIINVKGSNFIFISIFLILGRIINRFIIIICINVYFIVK